MGNMTLLQTFMSSRQLSEVRQLLKLISGLLLLLLTTERPDPC